MPAKWGVRLWQGKGGVQDRKAVAEVRQWQLLGLPGSGWRERWALLCNYRSSKLPFLKKCDLPRSLRTPVLVGHRLPSQSAMKQLGPSWGPSPSVIRVTAQGDHRPPDNRMWSRKMALGVLTARWKGRGRVRI